MTAAAGPAGGSSDYDFDLFTLGGGTAGENVGMRNASNGLNFLRLFSTANSKFVVNGYCTSSCRSEGVQAVSNHGYTPLFSLLHSFPVARSVCIILSSQCNALCCQVALGQEVTGTQ